MFKPRYKWRRLSRSHILVNFRFIDGVVADYAKQAFSKHYNFGKLSRVQEGLFKNGLLFSFKSNSEFMRENEDLARPCDGCGRFIGGGYRFRPKCKIFFCISCGVTYQAMVKVYPAKCPMCQGKFWFPYESKERVEMVFKDYVKRKSE